MYLQPQLAKLTLSLAKYIKKKKVITSTLSYSPYTITLFCHDGQRVITKFHQFIYFFYGKKKINLISLQTLLIF